MDCRRGPKLCALILYYPVVSAGRSIKLPPGPNILLHSVERQTFTGVHRDHYKYANVEAGFAAAKDSAFDKAAADLAWTRTLALLRKAFDIEVDLEEIWEEHLELEFEAKDVDATMATMVAEPYVNRGS